MPDACITAGAIQRKGTKYSDRGFGVDQASRRDCAGVQEKPMLERDGATGREDASMSNSEAQDSQDAGVASHMQVKSIPTKSVKYTYMYVCTCMYVCMHVCMYVCMYVHMRTHLYIYIYICVCVS